MVTTEKMNESFLEEYNSGDAILKYSTKTAGQGVNYLIQHEYARIYDQAVETCLKTSRKPLRILEFGCGAGMNLIGLVTRLESRGIAIERAWGADFSEALIESASQEARTFLSASARPIVNFYVARNETLNADLAARTGLGPAALDGSFDLILGSTRSGTVTG